MKTGMIALGGAKHRVGRIVYAMLASIVVGSTAFAQDVEIYTGTDSLGVNPNILFVIDTSGSMGGTVNVSDYDPLMDYAAPAGSSECHDNRLYVMFDANPPECDTDAWFEMSKFRCDYAWDALNIPGTGVGTGFNVDKYSRWSDGAWRELHGTFHQHRSVTDHYECYADDGEHGEDAVSTATHIHNSSGPWSTTNDEATGSGGSPGIWSAMSSITIYTGNYLNWYHYHGGSSGTDKTRLEVVVDAAKDLIDSVSGVNIGLMRFDSTGTLTAVLDDINNQSIDNHGGPVAYPMVDISVAANRTALKDVLDSFSPQGSTPLVETVHEGMQYLRGAAVDFGVPWTDGTQVSHADSQDGGIYQSPIEYDCGKNYMVVFTDGAPTADWDADSYVNTLVDGEDGDMGSCDHGTSTYFAEDSCLDELANYMFEADHSTSSFGADLPGVQNITSYYISGFVDENGGTFAVDEELMNAAAAAGGTDSAYSASNPSEFAAAFAAIVSEILEVNAAFTSPAVSVNALNRLRHNNDLYFALFQPERSPHWPGNIKKYRLETRGGTPADGSEPELFIGDAHDPPRDAVDPTTGLFVAEGEVGSGEEGALSYWYLNENLRDGDQTAQGGAAHRLYDWDEADGYDADSRSDKVFTYLVDYAPDAVEFDGSGISLTVLHEDNADPEVLGEDGINITKGSLGLPDSFNDNAFLSRIAWARGVDVKDEDGDGDSTEGRPVMGGILHTEPILVNYGVDDNGTATPSDDIQTDVLFTTTNDGYLHILRSDENGLSGKQRLEYSAVVPKSMLGHMEELYDDAGGDVAYRLDGNIEVWRYEDPTDADDDITTGSNDHVYLYFGQRRGGKGIFAFDVTDPDLPELLWVIDPTMVVSGSNDPDVGPFQFMGQSWSKPKKTRLLMANSAGNDLEAREVLVFGGGYDNDSDDIAGLPRNQDTFGSAIYIVDAYTGELLWWAGHSSFSATVTPDHSDSDMQHGFAADIRVADINGDGLLDSLFASDTGGQIWRFDIANALNAGDSFALSTRITGGVIADLQLSDETDLVSAANNRRLYYAPDVAIAQKDSSQPPFLTVSIGTGYRAHPLYRAVTEADKVVDKFFVLKYEDVLGAPAPELDESGNEVQDGYDRVKIHVDDLLDVTNLNFAAAVPPTLNADDESALENKGWYIDLTGDGEKALSESVTVAGLVVFTTYTPPVEDPDNTDNQACTGNQGTGKTYVVNLFDGRPVADLNPFGGDDLELADRVFNLTVKGIAPEPKVIFPDFDGVSGKVIVGRELLPINIVNAPEITYWMRE